MRSWIEILIRTISTVNDVKDLAEQYKHSDNRKADKRTYYFKRKSWAITMILLFLGFLFSLFLIFGDGSGFEGTLRQILGVIIAIYTGVHFFGLLFFAIIEIIGYKIEDKWREKHKENTFNFEEETQEYTESEYLNGNNDYQKDSVEIMKKENILNENGFKHDDDDD